MSDATDEGQSTARHTPGPWEVYPETVPIGEPKGYSVRASCEPSDKVCLSVTYSNALLMAAAPDMLKALNAANRYLADIATNGGPKSGVDGLNEWSEVQGTIAKAINAATADGSS